MIDGRKKSTRCNLELCLVHSAPTLVSDLKWKDFSNDFSSVDVSSCTTVAFHKQSEEVG